MLRQFVGQVKWHKICLGRENEGLGVHKAMKFNLSLLDKWCQMMHVDRESLWLKVLVASYGEDGARLKEGGSRASVWQKYSIGKMRGASLGVENVFDDNFVTMVDNGINSLFLIEPWLKGGR